MSSKETLIPESSIELIETQESPNLAVEIGSSNAKDVVADLPKTHGNGQQANSNAQVSVSVIIPFTRADKVGDAIHSVIAQQYPPDRMEIIVVGSGSDTIRESWPTVLAIDEGPILHPGKARNLGAAKASGDFLFFLDDDCVAHPGWIDEALIELENQGVGAVSGMIKGKSNSFIDRTVDFTNFGLCQTNERREGRLWSATLAIRSDDFERLGRFNEHIRVHEDIDLCFKLNRQGLATVYQPKIRVTHNHGRSTLRSLLEYQHFGGREAGLLIESENADLSLRNKLLLKAQNPLAYSLLVVPFALAGTLWSFAVNFREHPRILLLSPLIFLGKLSCQIGIWRWTLERWTHGSPTIQGAWRLIEYSLLKWRIRTPKILTLFVTSTCNAKCSHCFYWNSLNQKNDLTFEEMIELSDSMGTIDKLLVTGGEPFLRRDLAEICQLFFDNNNLGAVSIPTNGLQPEKTRIMARNILNAAKGRPVTISFSLDGTEHYHDEMRGVPGNFQKLRETYQEVKSLQKEYPNLILRVPTTVMQQNYDEVIRLLDELPEILPGVNSPCLNLLRGSPYDRSLMLPSDEEIRRLFEHKAEKSPGKQGVLRRLADRLTFAVAYENLRQDTQVIPCEAGRILGVVEDNGDVKPCELLPPVGNLREGTFTEIWNSSEAVEARRRIEAKECHCTHECNAFPSLMANPLHAAKLVRTIKK